MRRMLTFAPYGREPRHSHQFRERGGNGYLGPTPTWEPRMAPQPKFYKAKVCLVGEAAVGKTSLIRRYVYSQYSDSYLMTIGVKVSKKRLEIALPPADAPFVLELSI